MSHKVRICMPFKILGFQGILAWWFCQLFCVSFSHHASISKISTLINLDITLTFSRIVSRIVSLSSSCFLYFKRLSFSASLIASCLNLSCSCCSSLVVPLPSSLSPPTPGMLSENSQRWSKNFNYRPSSLLWAVFSV